MWAKQVGEDWIADPCYIETDNGIIINPKDEHFLANHFKPMRSVDMPAKAGCYYTPRYEDRGSYILRTWEEHEDED